MTSGNPRVGTLREKPLHAALKRWCAEPGDRFEIAVDGFVIDVVREGLLIEVQTSSFAKVRRKLSTLLEAGHAVRIVYPIAEEKVIVRIDDHGEIVGRRRSPKRGIPQDLFAELVSLPTMIDEPGMELELVMVREEEIRTHQPGKAWRRKGWVVEERHLIDVASTHRFSSSDDLADLLPGSLPDVFTTADLASELSRPKRLAQQMTYCLRHTGRIVQVGKRGNAIEYRRADRGVVGR